MATVTEPKWSVLALVHVALLLLVPLPGYAQDADTAAPTTQPAATPIFAKVIELHGDCRYAPISDEPNWAPLALNAELPELTMISTGIRASVKLQIGTEEPYTAMVIDSVSEVYLSEAYKDETTKHVRVGVGYGRIRAGVAEGGLQSDFTVDSPVATLSKRGTWNFGLAYDRGTDRFEIFLLDYGLVEALSKVRQTRRTVLPGEVVTNAMRRWFDEVQIRRNVAIVDILGQEDMMVAFNRLQNEGLGVVGPGSGSPQLLNLSNSWARREFAELARRALRNEEGVLAAVRRARRNIDIGGGGGGDDGGGGGGVVDNGPYRRPEGYFGSGGGDQLISVIVGQSSNLSAKGAARSGTYKIRRSALESWLSRNK